MIFDEMTTMRKLMLLHGVFDSKSIEEISTGNPLTFVTDLARPLKSLLIPFSPRQDGSGDPSPQNIRPILPWNGLKVFGGGKNLLPESAVEYGSYNTSGEKIQDGNNKYRRLSINLPAGNYVFSTDTENCIVIRLLVDDVVIGAGGKMQKKIISIENPANVKIAWRNDTTSEITETLHNQIELGSSVSAYEAPHITETEIPFASPVYGGTLDVVSGVLTVEWADFKFKWSECTEAIDRGDFEERKYSHGGVLNSKNGGNGICNVAPFSWTTAHRTWFYMGSVSIIICLPDGTPENTEIEVCAKLATPQEITLTPAQLTALVGENTIWSDADGQMTAVYLKKG